MLSAETPGGNFPARSAHEHKTSSAFEQRCGALEGVSLPGRSRVSMSSFSPLLFTSFCLSIVSFFRRLVYYQLSPVEEPPFQRPTRATFATPQKPVQFCFLSGRLIDYTPCIVFPLFLQPHCGVHAAVAVVKLRVGLFSKFRGEVRKWEGSNTTSFTLPWLPPESL